MKTKKGLIFGCIISLILFIVILVDVISKGFLVNLDLSLNSLNITRNSFLIIFSKIMDLLFDSASIIVISLFLSIFLWFRYSKKEAVFFSFTILLNAGIVYFIKEIVQRARPENTIFLSSGFAFPSGHSATAVVFFGLLIYLILRKSKSKNFKLASISFSVFMIILIAFTRVYLNMHWLSDILAGFFIGAFILTLNIILKEVLEFN